MHRRIWLGLMIVLLVVPVQVRAGQTGSIHLTLKHDGNLLPGGSVTLYNVTHWKTENDSDAEFLAAYANEYGNQGITKEVDACGCVSFKGLETGKYLLVQTLSTEGYHPMKPFVTELPVVINGNYIYHVTAEPKMELFKPQENLPQTGQLVWPAWAMGPLGLLLIGFGLLWRKQE